MILYRPTDGDVLSTELKLRPRTCFLMTQLGKPVPPELKKMRARVTAQLRKKSVKVIDADSIVTGKDFLAIDYLRRAYLISGDVRHRSRAKVLLNAAELKGRARNSVEMLLARF